ncbi:endolytic transglycosylase MltG [Patescibacteria group bacterium]|nr:endolytic transglycosylase MltG [Patescibacteria group bacterium]MBU0776782.1 endolytic transglycosylase MltG [Patescibacteria group bacterium]MBU0846354.1 endolytic transglycosylase MltG [Patescibacteria group bacterium]MBU0922685.1 endolytic transglycosylase MltG [Patescibacteria group bacterium]MBU1066736.1 endolytic transglycosylase MltG [Patescibacteria group bacterium]
MKRLIIPTLLITLLIISGVFWWKQNSKPVSTNESLQSFLIPKGYSASQIGNKLADQNLIKSSFAFKLYVQVMAKSKRIQAGEYLLAPSFSLFKIVVQLTSGPVEEWVTIPEGLRREEVVEKYISVLKRNETDAEVFRQDFLTITANKEGFLFPDTYLFPKTVSASIVANKMLSTFDSKISAQMDADINSSKYSLDQVIVLASIIERETRKDEERPVVAGILFNRLEIGMGLQVDATVQYALATANCRVGTTCDWWPALTRDDMSINSSYNTYKYAGIPSTPIANPSLSSIAAVIYPTDSSYLYYLHDEDGEIHYAETLDGHNENVRKYLGK